MRVASKNIISNIMSSVVFICPLAMAVAYFLDIPVWSCLLLMPVFLLLYAARDRINIFALFLLIHLALIPAPLFIRGLGIEEIVILMAFTISAVIFSIYCKIKGEMDWGRSFFCTGSVICVASAVLTARIDQNVPLWYFILLELIIASGYLMLTEMKSVDRSLEVLSSYSSQGNRQRSDNDRILNFNNRLTAGFVALFAAIAAFVCLVVDKGFMWIIENILNGATKFLRWFLALFMREGPASEIVEGADELIDWDNIDRSLLPFLYNKDSRFLEIATRIATVLLILLGAAVVAGGIIFLVRRLRKDFVVREHGGDVEETLDRDKITKLRRRPVFRDFGQGYEKKIRKLYYKAVRQRGAKPKKTDTTRDILNKMCPDIYDLTNQYEQTRYGVRNEI